MLKRTPMKPRTAGLAKTSKSHCRAKRVQRRAYQAAADAEQCWCSVCGIPGPVEHSHHFSQHQYPEHKNDERNWLQMGKYCGCHALYEHKRLVFSRRYPEVWAQIVACMKAVDMPAYLQAAALNPALYTD